MEGNIHQHKQTGLVRTDMHCHNCHKGFVAEIDYDVTGEFKIHCPHCDHQHWRVVKDGVMTDQRWGEGDNGQQRNICVKVWKHPKFEAKTSTASEFIRNRWLNFGRE